jgi:hypothetical protein
MSRTKEQRLLDAIMRVNNLCNELRIPPLVTTEAARTVLAASKEAWAKEKKQFLQSLGAQPLTKRLQ